MQLKDSWKSLAWEDAGPKISKARVFQALNVICSEKANYNFIEMIMVTISEDYSNCLRKS